MKKIFILLVFLLGLNPSGVYSQEITTPQKTELIPTCPEDPYISKLIKKLNYNPRKELTKEQSKLCREIGVAFYNKEMYDESDWYLEKVDGYIDVVNIEPEKVFEQPKEEPKEELSNSELSSIQSDKQFLSSLPKSYDNLSKGEMKKLADEIEGQLQKLTKEKEELAFLLASLCTHPFEIDGEEKRVVRTSTDKFVISPSAPLIILN